MKNTLMFLLVSLLLAFSLTACGGGGQTGGAADDYGSTGQTGTAGDNNSANGSTAGTGNGGSTAGTNGSTAGTGSSVTGNNGTAGASVNNGVSGGDGLVDDARDALDDAGRAVRNSVDDAARNF